MPLEVYQLDKIIKKNNYFGNFDDNIANNKSKQNSP